MKPLETLLLLAVASSLGAGVAGAGGFNCPTDDIFVDVNCPTPPGDGTQVNPFCTIQDAYVASLAATAPGSVCRIRVAPGTYGECLDLAGQNFTSMDEPVHLVAEDFLTQADNTTTIIDGTGICGGGVGPTSLAPTVTLAGTGATIEGFTVRGGGKAGISGRGSVVITNNLITGNQSELGGGIYLLSSNCYYGATTYSEISDNEVIANAAIPPDPASNPACTSCNEVFAPCGSGDGGGIFVVAESFFDCDVLGSDCPGCNANVVVDGNTIRNNTVENEVVDPCIRSCSGSGDPCENDTDCLVGETCDASGLVYTSNGAGLYVLTNTEEKPPGQPEPEAHVIVTQNLITGNSGLRGVSEGYGGGIYANTFGYGKETIDLIDNDVGGPGATDGNEASLSGGGISARIRPTTRGKHTINVDRNRIEGNVADAGGGGGLEMLQEANDFQAGASVVLTATHNTITDNQALGDGGGISAVTDIRRSSDGPMAADPADEITFLIQGNVLTGNIAGEGAGGALLFPVADSDAFIAGGCVGSIRADSHIDFLNNLVADNEALATTFNVVGGGVLVLTVTYGDALASVNIDQSTVADNTIGTIGVVGGLEVQAENNQSCFDTTVGATDLVLDRMIIVNNQGYGVGGPQDPNLTFTTTDSDLFGNQSGPFEDPFFGRFGGINIPDDPQLNAMFAPAACSPVFDINGQSAGYWANPDTNVDGAVDGIDVLDISVSFGSSTVGSRYDAATDLNRNGLIEPDEVVYMSTEYGAICP